MELDSIDLPSYAGQNVLKNEKPTDLQVHQKS